MRIASMGFVTLTAVTLLVASASGQEQRRTAAIDAGGAPAVEERSWELRGLSGETVGPLRSAVRCGDELFVAEPGRVRRLNIETGRQASPVGDGRVMPLSIAADCSNERLVIVTPPLPPARGLSAITFSTRTGERAAEQPLTLGVVPGSVAAVVGDELYLGSVTAAVGADSLLARPAASFFKDTTLATRVSLKTGLSEPVFAAYDEACPAAGACFETSVETLDVPARVWIIAQSASRAVGVYNAAGALERRITVDTPRFVRNGDILAPNDSAEARMRWSAANSRLYAAYAFPAGIIAVVHSRVALPPGWVFGQPVQWNAWMNLYTRDGSLLVSDIRLPDLPLGRDESAIYVGDYGTDGRQGAAEMVRIVRIPVRADRAAFK